MNTLQDNIRNAALVGIESLFNSGYIVFETSGDGEVATCTFAADAFNGSPSGGSVAFNAITQDSSATGGEVDHVQLQTSVPADIARATVGVGTNEFQFTGDLIIGAGDTVTVSGTITADAS